MSKTIKNNSDTKKNLRKIRKSYHKGEVSLSQYRREMLSLLKK